jgi:hypothetical protein
MNVILFKKYNTKMKKDLQDLERLITYPFGSTDRFYISHGNDYFQFFHRLGVPYWAALLDSNQKLCGQLCAILRKVPSNSGKCRNAWYVCDLKKAKSSKHANTLFLLFRVLFWRLIWKCQRGYAISMNPPGSIHPFRSLVKKSVFLPFILTSQLTIFSCSYKELNKVIPIIEIHRGSTGYLKLDGIKDIVLQKQGKLPLIHLQFGPLKAKSNFTPLPGYTYMWCSPNTDPMTQAFLQAGFTPTATATIFSFLMKNNPWDWILTSEI